MTSPGHAGANLSNALLWSMSKATRPWGPPAGARRQASSIGPSSPTLRRSRRAAGACSAGSSAAPS
eukprot:369646-Alexandrium_andersonii.AAC.1